MSPHVRWSAAVALVAVTVTACSSGAAPVAVRRLRRRRRTPPGRVRVRLPPDRHGRAGGDPDSDRGSDAGTGAVR
ncbi:hypothetical protein AADG42_07715 [Ammonicoccus fulvus]|uniref:Lipoprotein n=1 Tax=Ammonicoccus fulvus TaxID=3138240 RepID=A0ABZ3FP58_9ACTN